MKNADTGYSSYNINYGYYLCVFYKKDVDLRSKSKFADKLLVEFKKLIIICQENLYHTQEL